MNHYPDISLKKLRDSLSEETLKRSNGKAAYYLIRDFICFSLLTYIIWISDSPWVLVPTYIAQSLSIFGLFLLGHDMAHGALFKNKTLNYFFGQICFLPSLHPYSKWVYGHNKLHHGSTIQLKSDFAWHPRTVSKFMTLSKWNRFMHKLYWSKLGAGLYYLNKMWFQGLIIRDANASSKTKRDTFLVAAFALVATAVVFYSFSMTNNEFNWINGLLGIIKVQAIPFFLFCQWIGMVIYIQHIQDTVPWKQKEGWNQFYGQVIGTTNYKTNFFLNFFLHNILIHLPHHVHSLIPFYNLPRALDELKRDYPDYVVLKESLFKDYFEYTEKCKLIDANTLEWTTYPKLEAAAVA